MPRNNSMPTRLTHRLPHLGPARTRTQRTPVEPSAAIEPKVDTEERRTRSANDPDDEHTVECEHEHSATYPALDDYVDRQNAEQSDTHGGSFGTSALRA